MTAPAAPDIQRLRAETTERLDFARRVLGSDGALVAWQLADADPWLTALDDPTTAPTQIAAIEADLAAGRAGFDYGQRFVFAAGGRGAMLVRMGQAPSLCVAIDEAFRAGTDGRAVVASTYVPFDPDGSAEAEALAMSRLRRELAIGLDEADPLDALPPRPAPAPDLQLVAAAASQPFTALDDACGRLIDHAVAHASVAALVTWAQRQHDGLTSLGLGADPAFVAAPGVGLGVPAAIAATVAEGVHEARWHVGLEPAAAEAFAALRLDWGLVAARAPLGPPRLLPMARALARTAADHGGARIAVLTSRTPIDAGQPAAMGLPLADVARLGHDLGRLDALSAPQRAVLQAAAPARQTPDHPAASDLRAALARDPALRAWLGPDPSQLPSPAALALAELVGGP